MLVAHSEGKSVMLDLIYCEEATGGQSQAVCQALQLFCRQLLDPQCTSPAAYAIGLQTP